MLDQTLANRLLQEALDHTDHPADAVTVLMVGAATILARSFGDEHALELLTFSLDDTGAALRAAQMSQ